MSWSRTGGTSRRPVVSVEDHLYHTEELLDAASRVAPALLASLTVCAIERAGADTTRTVREWLERFPELQVAALVPVTELPDALRPRLISIDPRVLDAMAAFARVVASLLRPGGLLVQDVHLETLGFVPRDRWWESIYAGATVRGLFGDRPIGVRFLSNKRGYSATFGRELMDAGFDPRDVMDKAELESSVVPSIEVELSSRFPLRIEARHGASRIADIAGASDAARAEIDEDIDIVDWRVAGRQELGGRIVAASPDRVAFRSGSQEAATWQALVADRLDDGAGVSIHDVGTRIAEEGAARAEISNLAARHIHGLRARLADPAAILTDAGAYRLHDRLGVARVDRR
ncbi:MAG: hypothetical protein M3Q55_03740 [Acidobacteriota bacterium]|nr:hypothetical protein [Acidobacteriota bacterium]